MLGLKLLLRLQRAHLGDECLIAIARLMLYQLKQFAAAFVFAMATLQQRV